MRQHIVARQHHQVIAIGKDHQAWRPRQLRQARCLRGRRTIERRPVAPLQLARQAAQAMLERPNLRCGRCRLRFASSQLTALNVLPRKARRFTCRHFRTRAKFSICRLLPAVGPVWVQRRLTTGLGQLYLQQRTFSEQKSRKQEPERYRPALVL
jgi:hypothetical protein